MSSKRPPLHGARACYAASLDDEAGPVLRAERRRGGMRVEVLGPAAGPNLPAPAADLPCVGGLSARASFVRTLEAPFARLSKAEKVFPTLLDLELPFPLESCVYAFLNPQVTEEGKTRVTAVGARIADLETSLAAYRNLGLDPAVMLSEGLALWALARREYPAAANEARAVLNVSREDAALVIGSGDVCAGVYAVRTTSPEQRVQQLLRSHFEVGQPVSWIVGGAAADSEAANRIRAAAESSWPGSWSCVSEPASFAARALASTALFGNSALVNLRRGEFTHPLMRLRRRRVSLAAALSIALAGAVLGVAGAGWHYHARRIERRLDRVLAQTTESITGYPTAAKGEDAYAMAKRASIEARSELSPFMESLRPHVLQSLVEVMRAARADDLYLSRIVLEPDKAAVSGEAPDWNRPERLAAVLKARGIETNVDRQEARENGRVPFVLSTE